MKLESFVAAFMSFSIDVPHGQTPALNQNASDSSLRGQRKGSFFRNEDATFQCDRSVWRVQSVCMEVVVDKGSEQYPAVEEVVLLTAFNKHLLDDDK